MPLLTLKQTLTQATQRLSSHSEAARLEAEVLLSHSLAQPRSYLYARPEQLLTASPARHFQTLLAQRLQGHPIAYLTGTREFWSMALTVSRDTLIPRPETECLVENALALLPPQRPLRVADLGTGCGAVALAIAKERPNCHITATDQSPQALQIAMHNAQQLGLTNVQYQLGDWCAALAPMPYDLIVSNPPYIASDDPHLSQGDLRFEPSPALQSGLDGLTALRILCQQSPAHLKKNAPILLEHGYNQAQQVHALLAQSGFTALVTHHDQSGQPRISGGMKV